MKKIVFCLIVLLSLTTVTGQEECKSCTEIYNTIFNQHLTESQFTEEVAKLQVPKVVHTALGNKIKINLYLEEKIIGVQLEAGKIINMQEGALEDQKISIWTTTGVLQKIMTSQEKNAALKEALEKEEIKYQGHTIATKIKLKVAKKLLNKKETATGRMIQRIEHLKVRKITKTLKYQPE